MNISLPDTLKSFVDEQVAGSPLTAARYVDAIVTYCESLIMFPLRGTPRDDLIPGLRITNYRHSAVITFTVDVDTETVSMADAIDPNRFFSRL